MKCKICGKEKLISKSIGVCIDCIRNADEKTIEKLLEIHKVRSPFPYKVPKGKGVKCYGCANECIIEEGNYGFCGLVKNENGKLIRLVGTPEKGLLEWYYDPLPTNCVAEFVCELCLNPKENTYNLAIFYGACNLHCLFCQNWHYRELTLRLKPTYSSDEIVKLVKENVKCICFFGGDPGPQISHSLEVARKVCELRDDVRICYETNGLIGKNYLNEVIKYVKKTNGIIKVDFKFWSENLYKVISNCHNPKIIRKNIEKIAKSGVRLVISTLMIPGYVDEYEISKITEFIASLDENIPYVLLAYYPHYLMNDIGFTSKEFALKAKKIAEKNGLKNIFIGNIWLLK